MYKEIEMIPNQVYSILLEDWDEEITGVFVTEGKEWILLLDNQNDFILEGLRFVNKARLDEVLRDDDEKFKEKVFSKKYSDFSLPNSYNLNDTAKLLQQIKEENKLLHFDMEDEEEIIVGLIENIYDDKFELKALTSEAEWGENLISEFRELSTLAIDNDYLKSLNLLID
ncbi:hypothetical protein [Flavicella sp.]|uniref:hypothetical protein n=1 Tax=Flavicella sp. TaxID=2957742 RepID=UPI00301643B8